MLKSFYADQLKVEVYKNRREMGAAAAIAVADKIRNLLDIKEKITMVFAAAPSQNEFLSSLIDKTKDINWNRITVFHMDEYIGLSEKAPQRFGFYLLEHIWNIVNPGKVHLINSSVEPEVECKRYSALINEAGIDIVCLGIGENGHIAFNDPPVANFLDSKLMKVVELDEACRIQQVNDGCFLMLDDVPRYALTLTIPALLSGGELFCIVPGVRKRKAVLDTLYAPVTTACPATILRQHKHCTLYVDQEAYYE